MVARPGGIGVEFVDAAGVAVAQFGGGLAYDSADPEARTSVMSDLVGQFGAVVVVEVSIDPKWLADTKRVAPVVIDPGTTWVGLTSGDSWIQENIWSSQWSSNHLEAGWFADFKERRALMRFDLSALQADVIGSAKLSVFNRASATCNPTPVYLMKITQDWGPATVWPGPAVSSGYYDVKSFGLGPHTACPGAPGYVNFDAKQMVQEWELAGQPNYGMALLGGAWYSGKNMWSIDNHWMGAPMLTVTYNRRPSTAQLNDPPADAIVTSLNPKLKIDPSVDPDGDPVHYYFRVTTGVDGESGTVVANSGWTTQTEWTVPEGALADGGVYYWHAHAIDPGWLFSRPLYAPARKFTVNLRLGGSGPSPFDAAGPAKVNLASGNLVVATGSPAYATVGGNVGVSYVYNSLMPAEGGLTGQYFDTADMTGQIKLQRRDASIDMDWGINVPGQGVKADGFSARWTGYVTLPPGSDWQFGASSDDGVRIYVDDMATPVFDHWGGLIGTSPQYGSPTFSGDGAQRRRIKVEFREVTGPAYVRLWAKKTGAEQVVAPGWLTAGDPALPAGWAMSADLDGSIGYVRARVSGSSVALIAADGAVSTYTWTGSGWVPPSESDGVLTGAPGGELVLADDDGQVYSFNRDGELESVMTTADDRKPAAATFTWDDNRLTEIRDPVSGRVITLDYQDPSGSCPAGTDAPAGMLCEVHYWDGRSTRLFYSGGRLARIQDPPIDANATPVRYELTDFAYDTAGRLSTVRDPLAMDAISYGVRADDATASTVLTYATGANAGKVASVTLPAPTAGAARPAHSYDYSWIGGYDVYRTDVHVAGSAEPNGWARRVDSDIRYRPVSSTDATAKTTTTAWDPAQDRVLSTSGPAGLKTVTKYDSRDRPVTTIGPAPAGYFDANNNLTAAHSTDPATGDTPAATTRYDENIAGLAATFYRNTELSPDPAKTPSQIHTTGVGDPSGALAKNFGTGAPIPVSGSDDPFPDDGWSARYTGDITFDQIGTYTLKVLAGADEGTRMWIDDKLIAGNPDGASTPDAVSWGGDHLDAFYRGANNTLAHVYADANNQWARDTTPLGGELTSDPTVASRGPGRLDVFARGKNNKLYQLAYDGQQWSSWFDLGGTLTSGPDAVAVGERVSVFARGTDGKIWQRWWNASANPRYWVPWEPVPSSFSIESDPTVVYTGGAYHLFARGNGGHLVHIWYDTSWHQEDLGGTLTSGPEAASRAPGVISVYFRGGSGALIERWWNGSTWSSPWNMGGVMTGGPTAATRTGGRIDVIVAGTDNQFHIRRITGGAWTGWVPSGLTNERVGTFKVTDAAAAARPHRIRIETNKASGAASIGLNWKPPGGSEVPVPGAKLNARYGFATSAIDADGAEAATTLADLSYPNIATGLPVAVTNDPGGLALSTRSEYEAPGAGGDHYYRRTSRTLPAGNRWTYDYYGTGGNPVNATSPCAATNVDQGGALWKTTAPDPDGTGPQTARVEEFAYDATGGVVGARTNAEPWACTTRDGRGRSIRQTVPPSVTEPARTVISDYAVGGNPLVTSVTDAAGTITTTIDLLGRVVSYTDVWDKNTTTSYDQAGQVTQVTTAHDTFTYTYDPAGRVELVMLAGDVIADPVYDSAGRLDHATYPSGAGNAGNGTALAPIGRDALARVVGRTWTDPNGATTTSDAVTRSLGGKIRDETIDGVDANPAGDNFVYDRAGRLTRAFVAGHDLTYSFDPTGGCGPLASAGANTNRTAATDNGGPAVSYCYDHADRLTATTTPGIDTVSYDDHGNTTTLGDQTIGYDGADRHITSAANGTTVRYRRDATDRIVLRWSSGPGPVSWRSGTDADNGPGATSLVIDRPADVGDGDVLVAQVVAAGGSTTTVSPPAGWTTIGSVANGTGVRSDTFWHAATGSDPPSWTWGLTPAVSAAGGIAAYSGVDPADPIDANTTAVTSGSTAHSAPPVTTTAYGDLVVTTHGLVGATSVNSPPGFTERHDRASAGGTPVTGQLADQLVGVAGVNGPHPATTAAPTDSASQTIALNAKVTSDAQLFFHTGAGDSPDVTYKWGGAIQRHIGLPGGVALTKTATGDTWSYPNIHGDVTATTDQTGTKQGPTRRYDPYGNALDGLPDNSADDYDNGWLGQHQRGTEHRPGLQPTIQMGARQYSPPTRTIPPNRPCRRRIIQRL